MSLLILNNEVSISSFIHLFRVIINCFYKNSIYIKYVYIVRAYLPLFTLIQSNKLGLSENILSQQRNPSCLSEKEIFGYISSVDSFSEKPPEQNKINSL